MKKKNILKLKKNLIDNLKKDFRLMRRIKSAPDNISLMGHKKKKSKTSLATTLPTKNQQSLKIDRKNIMEKNLISPFFPSLYNMNKENNKKKIITLQEDNTLSNLFLSYNQKIKNYLLRNYQYYFNKQNNWKKVNMKKVDNKFKNSDIKLNNYKHIKDKKNIISFIGITFNDLITNNNLYLFDFSKLLELSITFFSENFFRKDKLKELIPFILQYFARYLISILVHKYILFHIQLSINLPDLIHF